MTSCPTACDAKYTATDDIDATWQVVMAQNIFLMQIGFMLLEVGSVRAMHAKAICVKVTASPSWPLDAVKSCDARSGPAPPPPPPRQSHCVRAQ